MEKDTATEIFHKLRQILEPYAKGMDLKQSDEGYSLTCKKEVKKGMPMFFGAASIGKNYVSFHLMPVYVDPALLEGISPELKKRMQGKSCFNFKKPDATLFKELKVLTKKGHAAFVNAGWIVN